MKYSKRRRFTHEREWLVRRKFLSICNRICSGVLWDSARTRRLNIIRSIQFRVVLRSVQGVRRCFMLEGHNGTNKRSLLPGGKAKLGENYACWCAELAKVAEWIFSISAGERRRVESAVRGHPKEKNLNSYPWADRKHVSQRYLWDWLPGTKYSPLVRQLCFFETVVFKTPCLLRFALSLRYWLPGIEDFFKIRSLWLSHQAGKESASADFDLSKHQSLLISFTFGGAALATLPRHAILPNYVYDSRNVCLPSVFTAETRTDSHSASQHSEFDAVDGSRSVRSLLHVPTYR